mgnify:CR=1 FL=1
MCSVTESPILLVYRLNDFGSQLTWRRFNNWTEAMVWIEANRCAKVEVWFGPDLESHFYGELKPLRKNEAAAPAGYQWEK